MAGPDAVVPTKRKRATISYAELDALDDSLESDVHAETSKADLTLRDDDSDEDLSYGSKKNPHAIKARAKKKKLRLQAGKPKASKTSKTKPFRFLDLPPELRDQIYDLALTQPGGLTIVSNLKGFRRTVCRGIWYNQTHPGRTHRPPYAAADIVNPVDEWRHLVPNLLAVSKQVRAEGVGYLYKQEIIFNDTSTMHTFLAAIGQFNRLVLSDIVVKEWGHGRGVQKAMNVAALTALATCTNLESVYLDCEIDGWQRTPQLLAKQIFRDGHYFLEQFGAANGRKDAAVDVLQLSDSNFGSTASHRRSFGQGANNTPEEDESEFEEELRRLLSR